MIDSFFENLPRDISIQLKSEYSSRIKDVKFLLHNTEYQYYNPIRDDLQTVELLLALSIFYKRVILNLESVTKFSSTIYKKSDAEGISIGSYNLSPSENMKISSTVLQFKKIVIQYSIHPSLFEYKETKEFLKNIVNLKLDINNNKDESES